LTQRLAILWPPSRRLIVVASDLTESTALLEARNTALAAVGRAVTLVVG
jgi:hypothetical protein